MLKAGNIPIRHTDGQTVNSQLAFSVTLIPHVCALAAEHEL